MKKFKTKIELKLKWLIKKEVKLKLKWFSELK